MLPKLLMPKMSSNFRILLDFQKKKRSENYLKSAKNKTLIFNGRNCSIIAPIKRSWNNRWSWSSRGRSRCSSWSFSWCSFNSGRFIWIFRIVRLNWCNVSFVAPIELRFWNVSELIQSNLVRTRICVMALNFL